MNNNTRKELENLALNAKVTKNTKTIDLSAEGPDIEFGYDPHAKIPNGTVTGGQSDDDIATADKPSPVVYPIAPREDGYEDSISIIVAMNKRGVIGHENKLPWRLKSDLKFFKETTMDSVVIMGRKTWESIGESPLPGRINIIITSNAAYQPLDLKNVMVAHSVESAIRLAKCEHKDIFIIGGASIYQQALPICDTLYLTVVDNDSEGDTVFPTGTYGIGKLGDLLKTLGFNNYETVQVIEADESNECKAEVLKMNKVIRPDVPSFDTSLIKKMVGKVKCQQAKAFVKEKKTTKRRARNKIARKSKQRNRK